MYRLRFQTKCVETLLSERFLKDMTSSGVKSLVSHTGLLIYG